MASDVIDHDERDKVGSPTSCVGVSKSKLPPLTDNKMRLLKVHVLVKIKTGAMSGPKRRGSLLLPDDYYTWLASPDFKPNQFFNSIEEKFKTFSELFEPYEQDYLASSDKEQQERYIASELLKRFINEERNQASNFSLEDMESKVNSILSNVASGQILLDPDFITRLRVFRDELHTPIVNKQAADRERSAMEPVATITEENMAIIRQKHNALMEEHERVISSSYHRSSACAEEKSSGASSSSQSMVYENLPVVTWISGGTDPSRIYALNDINKAIINYKSDQMKGPYLAHGKFKSKRLHRFFDEKIRKNEFFDFPHESITTFCNIESYLSISGTNINNVRVDIEPNSRRKDVHEMDCWQRVKLQCDGGQQGGWLFFVPPEGRIYYSVDIIANTIGSVARDKRYMLVYPKHLVLAG